MTSILASPRPTAKEPRKASLISLPRELRDHIYELLVVAPQPIRFDKLFGPLAYDIEGPNLLYGWDVLLQITREACEIFYQRNTFEVFSDDLPLFLSVNVRRWVLHEYPNCQDWLTDSPPTFFDTELHVMNLKVSVPQERRSESLTDDLACLLECDRPQNVKMEFRWFTWQTLDDASKTVLEELQRKLGTRLDVSVEGMPRDRSIEYWL